jgi:hypothetical protein
MAWIQNQQKASRRNRTPKKHNRKSGFEIEWVRVPARWLDRLLAADVGAPTLKLALIILRENFKLDQMAVKEVVLSREVTGMKPDVRRRAIDSLVKLKLVRVRRRPRTAARVIDLYGL